MELDREISASGPRETFDQRGGRFPAPQHANGLRLQAACSARGSPIADPAEAPHKALAAP